MELSAPSFALHVHYQTRSTRHESHSIHLKRYQPNQALRIELVLPSVRGGWLGRGCPVTRRPYVNFIRPTYLPLNSLDHVFPPARTAVGGGTSGAIPESERPQNGKGSGVLGP